MGDSESRLADYRLISVGYELVRFLRVNGQQLLLDAIAILGWLFVLTMAFQQVTWPRWAYYLLLFAGILAYSELTDGWTIPGEDPRGG